MKKQGQIVEHHLMRHLKFSLGLAMGTRQTSGASAFSSARSWVASLPLDKRPWRSKSLKLVSIIIKERVLRLCLHIRS